MKDKVWNNINILTHSPDGFILDNFCTVLKKMGISWTLNSMVLTDVVLNKIIDYHVCIQYVRGSRNFRQGGGGVGRVQVSLTKKALTTFFF